MTPAEKKELLYRWADQLDADPKLRGCPNVGHRFLRAFAKALRRNKTWREEGTYKGGYGKLVECVDGGMSWKQLARGAAALEGLGYLIRVRRGKKLNNLMVAALDGKPLFGGDWTPPKKTAMQKSDGSETSSHVTARNVRSLRASDSSKTRNHSGQVTARKRAVHSSTYTRLSLVPKQKASREDASPSGSAAAVDSNSERFRPANNFKESQAHPGADLKESAEAPRPDQSELRGVDGPLVEEAIGLPPEWTSRPPSPPTKRPEPPPGVVPLPDVGPAMSSEDRFYALAAEAEAKGVPKSQIGRLLTATEGDFDHASRKLRAAFRANRPSGYLHKAIEGILADQTGSAPPVIPQPADEPEWIADWRREGYRPEKLRLLSGRPGWRLGGTIFTSSGDAIGA